MLFWTGWCLSSFSTVVKTHREVVRRQPEVVSVGVGFLCLLPAPESQWMGPTCKEQPTVTLCVTFLVKRRVGFLSFVWIA